MMKNKLCKTDIMNAKKNIKKTASNRVNEYVWIYGRIRAKKSGRGRAMSDGWTKAKRDAKETAKMVGEYGLRVEEQGLRRME